MKPEAPTGILNLSDVYEDPRFQSSRVYSVKGRSAFQDIWRARSVLIGPVMRDGQCVGIIEVINKKAADGRVIAFSKGDEKVMQLLCNHCSCFVDQVGDDLQGILTEAC